jgi:hypothetical protein
MHQSSQSSRCAFETGLQLHKEAVGEAHLSPAAEALIDDLPRAEAVERFTPGRSSMQHRANAVDDCPIVRRGPAARPERRQQRPEERPLLVRTLVSVELGHSAARRRETVGVAPHAPLYRAYPSVVRVGEPLSFPAPGERRSAIVRAIASSRSPQRDSHDPELLDAIGVREMAELR